MRLSELQASFESAEENRKATAHDEGSDKLNGEKILVVTRRGRHSLGLYTRGEREQENFDKAMQKVQSLDEDGDGKITKAEMIHFVKDFVDTERQKSSYRRAAYWLAFLVEIGRAHV